MFMHVDRNCIVRSALYFCDLFLFVDYRDDIIMVLSCFSEHLNILTYPVVKSAVFSLYKYN